MVDDSFKPFSTFGAPVARGASDPNPRADAPAPSPTASEPPKAGWLEIVHEGGSGPLAAFCPYRKTMVAAEVCFACKDCSGIAMSPETLSSYVVCDRAAADHIGATGGDLRAPLVHTCACEDAETPPDKTSP